MEQGEAACHPVYASLLVQIFQDGILKDGNLDMSMAKKSPSQGTPTPEVQGLGDIRLVTSPCIYGGCYQSQS
jgi:hypothetical protein